MTYTEICHTHLTSLLIMNKFYVTVPDTAALTAQIAQLQQAIVAADAREDRVAAGTVAREQRLELDNYKKISTSMYLY